MIFITLGIAVALIVIDQLTKLYISNHFTIGQVKELIAFGSHKILSITHIRNSGAAWSMMQGRRLFLIAFPILLIGAIIVLMAMGKIRSKLGYISLALIIAGGVGNLIDRIRLHEVVDFIRWEAFDFPVFNFADICVVIGAILFCIYYLIIEPKLEKASVTAEKKAQSDEAEVPDSGDGPDDE